MLPSLSALRAFDAAAKTGSFRAAAEHLVVTPTAISHHIRGLEDQLGTLLFERVGREVRLTEDGTRLAETTGRAFGMLEDTVGALRRTSRKVVRLAAGPILTARWLMPRISDLWQSFPEVELEVVPSYRPRMMDQTHADIVLSWHRLADMPRGSLKLLELRPVAIASAQYIDQYGPLDAPEDLLNKPILHQRNHWGWLDWFAAMNVQPGSPLMGVVFEDANILLRGAAEGQGAVVGWLPLIDQDLREGRILRLFDEDIKPTHGYFVEAQDGSRDKREVRDVIEWLRSQSCEPG
ncbi:MULTISPECIES: LysR family transcriptional regulator [unclassified Ruegeria]|uniref:LysR family transcriptional regulator n=1 Tax=unclassified Ruegeria TaxID=2625375 RepID=UPI0014878E65|nr:MULTISPECIES: LysR family transcriptional regulator [unclassified Ruegeria]NOD64617.1 LysR family transcriptional regulator [Ruegeria sp. HKCCD6109]